MQTRIAPALALLALAACEAPPDADFRPTEAARAAPEPELAETARFAGLLASAAPDAERLAAGSEALAARRDALRARAAALAGPVLAPDARTRLEAARPGSG